MADRYSDRTTELMSKIKLVEMVNLEECYDEMEPSEIVQSLDIIERAFRVEQLHREDVRTW